tara:strand:- start:589 stop:765 length:177 start_codon:yes stop_codon:yes gene_type:complete
MANYSLTDEQVKALVAILSAAQIRGSDAPTVMNLAKALQSPLVEKPRSVEEEVKEEVK